MDVLDRIQLEGLVLLDIVLQQQLEQLELLVLQGMQQLLVQREQLVEHQ